MRSSMTRNWAGFLPLTLAITLTTGCGMDGQSSQVPPAGVKTSEEAAVDIETMSSELLDLIGVRGSTPEPGPGVSECGDGKDREKYFQMRHPWSLTPASGKQLDGVMERLRDELPRHGWKVVQFEYDTSRNKNLNLTADHDERRYSMNVVHLAKNDPPSLAVTVVSGCYQTPSGKEVVHF
jgi:hypothetical protein